MSTQRAVGFVCLVSGTVLFIVGVNATESFGDQVSSTFSGKWTDSTAWYIYGGLSLVLFGGLAALFGSRRATT